MKQLNNIKSNNYYAKIISEVNSLAPEKLYDVYRILHEMNKINTKSKSHIISEKAISDEDAEELKNIIDAEFNRIEGEW